MDKSQKLQVLQKDLESKKDMPLIKSPEDVVFGDGNPNAEIMFIGEAAGYWESIKRKPFVGNAGKLLDEVMNSVGVNRADVYITNMIKTRPPGNRDPLPEELEAFAPFVDEEIEIINPKIIATLGRFSMGKFLPDVKISGVHGKVFKINWKGKDRVVMPMFHPAAALRRGDVMEQFRNDFKILQNLKKELKDREELKKAEQLNLI